MCGISGIHFFNHKKASLEEWEKEVVVNDLLLGIERRGTDATGIATIKGNGDIWVEKAELEATEFIKHRTSLDKRVKTILLHTRYATKGHQSNNLNNHPVINNNSVIIHNGHIRNDDELFTSNADLIRTAQVDSEAIAALFDKFGIEKANMALQELEGGFAIAAIDQRIPTALVLAKGKSSPLAYYKNDNFIVWASEGRVIIDAFEKVKPGMDLRQVDIDYLREGDILYMDNGKVEEFSFKVKEEKYFKGTSKFHSSYSWHSWDDWDKEEKEKEKEIPMPKSVIPRVGTYQIYVDGRAITYRCCFKCGVASNEDFLKSFDGGFWCEPCFENEVEWIGKDVDPTWDKEIEEENKILVAFEKEEDEMTIDHMVICEKIGKEVGISKGMVDYLLFECEELMDREIENKMIQALYDQLSTLYDIELGIMVGDEVEQEEAKAKKMELVKLPSMKQQHIGL